MRPKLTGKCPACGKALRLKRGKIPPHQMADTVAPMMCSGAGKAPS